MVISALRAMKEPVLADAVAVVCKCESLHEPSKQESRTWDKNIRKIKLLDKKLQQGYQYFEKEWKKDEIEWCEFLMELKKIGKIS